MPFDARTLSGVGVLAAVVEAGSFARAGEALGLTASGVSRAVARLEARVGVRLFNRSPRSVSLTDEGRRFHDDVTPLLDAIEESADALAGSAVVVKGRLRVSVDPWFARMVMGPALPTFLAAHPALSLDIVTSNHREEMMTGVDVAIRFGPPEGASLIALKIADTPVITCASPAYLDRHGTPSTPADLVNHETILFRDPQTGRPFAWEYGGPGGSYEQPVQGRLVLDDPSVAIEACVAGQGIFQSLAMGLGRWLNGGQLVEILKSSSNERFALYAYRHARTRSPAKIEAFLRFVQQLHTL